MNLGDARDEWVTVLFPDNNRLPFNSNYASLVNIMLTIRFI